MKPEDLTASLRAVAALRSLCLVLPHLPTPAETERLKRFGALMASPGSATPHDVEALVAGWQDWWRSGRIDDLVAMAAELPAGLVQQERRLASYLHAARELNRKGHERR
ncbi:MAG TPA: hypothetical protein VJO34_00925 [Methylomirabilota bacterium]|nr:hypothetical protein [Methylomirabilota bacterium]